MPDKIKVAHVIRVFSYGGAEVLLRDFFNSDNYKANTITDLFILDHKKLGFLDIVKPNIRNYYFYKITTVFFFIEYIKFLRRLSKGKYDIIHTHLPVAAWMTIVAKLFLRRPKFVYTEHSLVTSYSRYNYYLGGIAFSFFDTLIFISEEARDVFRQQQKLKWFYRIRHSAVILNGVDTDKYNCHNRLPLPANRKITVGIVCRFRYPKRLDRWVEVAEAIIKLNNQFSFIMIGDGPADEMVRGLIKEKNLTGFFSLPGSMNDTSAAYCKMDFFLFTSDVEGLPLSLVEAMSAGCVPITCNIGGIRQMKIEGFGYKYEEFNAQKIAETIVAYTNNPDQFAKESLMARNYAVSSFSLKNQVAEVLELYSSIIAGNQNN